MKHRVNTSLKQKKLRDGGKIKQVKSSHKSRNQQQVLDNLYNLPLNIKIKIYGMCIETHMEEWEQDSREKMESSFTLIESAEYWPECYNQREIERMNHGWDYWGDVEGFRTGYFYKQELQIRCFWHDDVIKSPWHQHKVLIPCHEMNLSICNDGNIDEDKVEDFYIDTEKITDEIYCQIRNREWIDRDNLFWAAKKCRCLQCDIIRLQYHKQNPQSRAFHGKINQTYCRTEYDPREKKWTTETKQQVLRKKRKKKIL